MGKKKIKDAEITLEEAIALLKHPLAEKSLKSGSIDYSAGLYNFSLDDVRPADMVSFVREHFTPWSSIVREHFIPWSKSYVTVRHEAYLDSRSVEAEVEHVLKLAYGLILGMFEERTVKDKPLKHATLKFSMAKFAGPIPRVPPQPEPLPPDEDYKSS